MCIAGIYLGCKAKAQRSGRGGDEARAHALSSLHLRRLLLTPNQPTLRHPHSSTAATPSPFLLPSSHHQQQRPPLLPHPLPTAMSEMQDAATARKEKLAMLKKRKQLHDTGSNPSPSADGSSKYAPSLPLSLLRPADARSAGLKSSGLGTMIPRRGARGSMRGWRRRIRLRSRSRGWRSE